MYVFEKYTNTFAKYFLQDWNWLSHKRVFRENDLRYRKIYFALPLEPCYPIDKVSL